jgi:Phage tail tube protein
MAQRFAGIAYLTVAGQQLALRGNFTVSASPMERTMLAGQDRVHGYQELPRVPYIEGDISTVPDQSLDDLDNQTDVTVIAQLANGKQYTLIGATCKGALENNTRDGQVRVRWEGLWCEEQLLASTVNIIPGLGAVI